jgi:hypothetical protein
MKNTSFILFALLIVLAACKKTDKSEPVTGIQGCMDPNSLNYNPAATLDDGTCLLPEHKQNGIVVEYTSTGCSNCGYWGSDTLHNLYKKGNVVAIAMHGWNGDAMLSPVMMYFIQSRPLSATPAFWVGDSLIGGIPGSYSSWMNTIKSKAPVAGVTFTSGISGNTMNVSTLTEFFQTCSGDYYLGVYVLESGIDGSNTAPTGYVQEGTYIPDTYKHDFVLRTSNVADNAFGEKITTTVSTAAGTFIRKNYAISLDPAWNKNVYAVAVLWKKNGNFYNFINAKEFGSHSSN